MKAELVLHNNDDLLCVNAARVSMDKESSVFTFRKDKPKGSDEGLVHYLADHRHWTPFSHVRFTLIADQPFINLLNIDPEHIASAVWRTNLETGEFKFRTSLFGWVNILRMGMITPEYRDSVINFLFEKVPHCAKALMPEVDTLNPVQYQAWEPEIELDPAFVDVTMRETIPIFIARQRFKHMVGTTYNEVSRRYVDDTPEFYHIKEWRSRPDGSIKQGSGDIHPDSKSMAVFSRSRTVAAGQNYDEDIKDGFAPEQARSLLPQNMLTSYYVTASLNAWKRAYDQRIDSHAQKEIQTLAQQWNEILTDSPHGQIWKALTS